MPARTWSASSCAWRSAACALRLSSSPCATASCGSTDWRVKSTRCRSISQQAVSSLAEIWDFLSSTGAMRPCLDELLVDLDLRDGGVAVALGLGEGGLAFERLAFELRAQVDEPGLRGGDGGVGVEGGLLQFGVAQDEDDACPASTVAPGKTTMRSTRASVRAAIQRISSGTSVPSPRTCRIIGPRRTVSVQTLARSTVGSGGPQPGETRLVAATRRSTASRRARSSGGAGGGGRCCGRAGHVHAVAAGSR